MMESLFSYFHLFGIKDWRTTLSTALDCQSGGCRDCRVSGKKVRVAEASGDTVKYEPQVVSCVVEKSVNQSQ